MNNPNTNIIKDEYSINKYNQRINNSFIYFFKQFFKPPWIH